MSVDLLFLSRGTESPGQPAGAIPSESVFHRRRQQMYEGEEMTVLELFIMHEVLAACPPWALRGTRCLDTIALPLFFPSEFVLFLLGGTEEEGKSNVLLCRTLGVETGNRSYNRKGW